MKDSKNNKTNSEETEELARRIDQALKKVSALAFSVNSTQAARGEA
jgi:hypothetical protein